MNREILGLSEDICLLMEKCWDLVPSARPHVADLLNRFESASRGWVPPTPEEIANLGLERPTSRYTMAKSTDTMSETASGMTEGGGVGPHETRQLPLAPDGAVEATTV